MFPTPQDALPLPPRPNLDQYKKRAKDLLRASQSTDQAAIRTWAASWIDLLVRLSDLTLTPQLPVRIDHWTDQLETFAREKLSESNTLTAAQFVIARAQGFESWPKLAKHIEAVAGGNSDVNNFERAAAAIVSGDIATLERLLHDHPDLIRAHSSRRHQATLLHYVSANGIEGYRQKTPTTIAQRGARSRAAAPPVFMSPAAWRTPRDRRASSRRTRCGRGAGPRPRCSSCSAGAVAHAGRARFTGMLETRTWVNKAPRAP